MKPIFYSLLLMILFSACKDLDELTQFKMKYQEEVTIPSTTGIDLPFNVLTPDVSTNAEATFSANKTTRNLVQEIRLETMTLTLNLPANGDFDFLKSITIYLEAPDLPETKIAFKEGLANTGSRTIELDVVGQDLREYIIKSTYTLRVSTITDELITSDHQIQISSSFHVNAKILGV